MKKIIILACSLMALNFLYAEKYTYTQLIQSMEEGNPIQLKAGDELDFENGTVITIQGEQNQCVVFGTRLEEIEKKMEDMQKQTQVKL